MSTIETGGPAFPMQEPQAIHAFAVAAVDGITDPDERDRAYIKARAEAVCGATLRDYFAAKAMPLAWKIFDEGYSPDALTPENIARAAYQMADALPPADASLLAIANRELADRLARVAHVLRGSGLEGLKDLDDGADLQTAAAALTGAYQMALANLQARGEQILEMQYELNKRDDKLFVQAALVVNLRSSIETMQREAMRGASLVSGQDRYTAAGYMVRASKRKPRTLLDKDKARYAALSSIRAGAQRAEVFALVPIGHARRGAEWRPS